MNTYISATLMHDTQTIERTWKCALYLRLSKEDGDKVESDSITNQKALITEYVKSRPELQICSERVDDGFSGVDFQRPAFIAMMNDIKAGLIDCVIVKDLSRFGRNWIETGKYIEQLFPHIGVRFIAINDSVDSNTARSQNDNISIPFKNLINDIYARDISHKITPVLRGKQERGDFIGAWASYGYLKSVEDKHKLVVDDETAHIVRDMFQWRSEGMSIQNVFRKLESLQIPSPSSYRYAKGIMKNEKYGHVRWWVDTVKKILTSEVYLGHMVQGRKKESLFHWQKQAILSKDQWVIVRNTHEAIIDQELFVRVQQIMETAHYTYMGKLGIFEQVIQTENLLKGLIYCGECRKLLTRYKNVRVNKNKEPKYHIWYSYTCPTHVIYGNICSFTGISEKAVNNTVFGVIQTQLLTALDMEKLIQSARNRTAIKTEKQKLQAKIQQVKDEIFRINRLRESLYDDYLDKLINEHDYLFAQNRYKEKEADLNHRLTELKAEDSSICETKFEDNPWLKALLHFRDEPMLTRKMAEELIESVVIHSNTAVTVNLRFRDEYRQLQKGLSPLLSEVAANE